MCVSERLFTSIFGHCQRATHWTSTCPLWTSSIIVACLKLHVLIHRAFPFKYVQSISAPTSRAVLPWAQKGPHSRARRCCCLTRCVWVSLWVCIHQRITQPQAGQPVGRRPSLPRPAFGSSPNVKVCSAVHSAAPRHSHNTLQALAAEVEAREADEAVRSAEQAEFYEVTVASVDQPKLLSQLSDALVCSAHGTTAQTSYSIHHRETWISTSVKRMPSTPMTDLSSTYL